MDKQLKQQENQNQHPSVMVESYCNSHAKRVRVNHTHKGKLKQVLYSCFIVDKTTPSKVKEALTLKPGGLISTW